MDESGSVFVGLLIVFGAVALFGLVRFILRLNRARNARNWPTVSASIRVATAVEREIEQGSLKDEFIMEAMGKRHYAHIGVLTYFYEDSGEQMGEFEKRFRDKSSAEKWAAAYRDREVSIHVDPSNPANSVLFEEDLP